MAEPILPFALELVLCEDMGADDQGRLDILGTFRSVGPESYPYLHTQFAVAAQLSGGLGELSTLVDVRVAEALELIYWTTPQKIRLDDRNGLVYLLNRLEDSPSPKPGIYFVELYCENTCIADYRLQLLEPPDETEAGES